MRRVILALSLSLDGFVAPANGAPDHRTLPEDPTLKQIKLDWLREVGTHAMGRVTYNEMAAHWPVSTDAYAPPMNDLPKVVFSKDPSERRVEQLTSGARRPRRRDLHFATRARRGHHRLGGASFAQALSRAGLVDEYRLVINPVALGDGLPLFKDLSVPIRLQLVQARTFPNGSALHVYQPAA